MYPGSFGTNIPRDVLEELPIDVTPLMIQTAWTAAFHDGYHGEEYASFTSEDWLRIYEFGYSAGEKQRQLEREVAARPAVNSAEKVALGSRIAAFVYRAVGWLDPVFIFICAGLVMLLVGNEVTATVFVLVAVAIGVARLDQ